MEVLHFLFGIFGNATALFLFLAPTITFRRIIRSKSTEQFSGIPYVMTLLNCLLSAWYGLPFVSPDNILVSTINGTGAVIESVYVLMFIIYAPKREKLKILGLFTLVVTFFSTVALVSLLALHGHTRKFFCGLVTTIFSIVMYASPLSIMRLVIKTKSVEFMPFFLSLFVFLCGTSWFVFGLLGRDPFVAIPNGFGCGLGAVQLILYAIYCNNKGEATKKKGTTVESVEMGSKGTHQDKQPNPTHHRMEEAKFRWHLRLVIKTKSVEFMPFFLSLFVFLCGTSWFVFGLLGRDPFVAIPNGFGCGLGAVQLILYAIYCNNKGEATKKKGTTVESVEMGSKGTHQDKQPNPTQPQNGGSKV